MLGHATQAIRFVRQDFTRFTLYTDSEEISLIRLALNSLVPESKQERQEINELLDTLDSVIASGSGF